MIEVKNGEIVTLELPRNKYFITQVKGRRQTGATLEWDYIKIALKGKGPCWVTKKRFIWRKADKYQRFLYYMNGPYYEE